MIYTQGERDGREKVHDYMKERSKEGTKRERDREKKGEGGVERKREKDERTYLSREAYFEKLEELIPLSFEGVWFAITCKVVRFGRDSAIALNAFGRKLEKCIFSIKLFGHL